MNHIARGGKIVYSKYFLKGKKEERKVGKLDKNSVKDKDSDRKKTSQHIWDSEGSTRVGRLCDI